MSAVWAARAITPSRELERVRVRIADGRIGALEHDVAADPEDDVFEHGTLVPGLIDLQVNGGDGGAYADEDPKSRARATHFHVANGTTGLLATLVSAPVDLLERSLRALAAEVDADHGPVLGVHLEGPFLAPAKRGAHAERSLCEPTQERVDALLAAAGGALRMLTLAPELPGALVAVERLCAAGVLVAAGHSRATLAQVRAAVERGLSFVTHVGNASEWPTRPVDPERGFRASEPGLVGAFMLEPRLAGSLILDGFHLHPELARSLVELRGVERVALVSDATPAAGLPPGRYDMLGLEVEIHADGYATAGEGLAGSVIPLVSALATAVRAAGLPLVDAVRMCTRTPASLLGIRAHKGAIEVGCDADLLVLDADLAPTAVYARGRRVTRS